MFASETREKAQDFAEALTTPISTRSLVRFFHYGLAHNLPQKIKDNPNNLEIAKDLLDFCYCPSSVIFCCQGI